MRYNKLKISLIIGTLNRPEKLKICLRSFLNQVGNVDVEIIIIDQSDNTATEHVCRSIEFKPLNINYRHVDFKGLSKARNDALSMMTGDYFGLVDDDAMYSERYLEKASHLLKMYKKTILSGYLWDVLENTARSDYDKAKTNSYVSIRQILRMCPSAGLIFPAELKNNIGYFDEAMGVGSRFGACEETDYILRAIKKGYKVFYCKELKFDHPIGCDSIRDIGYDYSKIEYYYSGVGYLLKKHLFEQYNVYLIPYFVEIAAKICIKCSGIMGMAFKKKGLSELKGLKKGLRLELRRWNKRL